MKKFLLVSVSAFALIAGAQASSLFYIEDGSSTLNVFDTVTLTSSLIGSTGIATSFGDMAFDRTTGVMYAVGGRGDRGLYTINLLTGAATLVGAHGIEDMFALGVDGAGNLVAQSTNNSVYNLNKVTGAASAFGSNSVYPGGYTFNTITGQMIFMEAGGGGIYDVNLTNGSTTLLASPGFNNDSDIAFDASTNDYWAMDYSGDVFSYDSAFNRTTVAGGFGFIAAVEFGSFNPVPEPFTMGLLGLGAFVGYKRRRKSARA